ADHHHHSASSLADHVDELLRLDARVRLVERMNLQLGVAEDAAGCGVESETVKGGERVRRNRRAKPLDDVAVVVVVRRLHQDEAETGHALSLSRAEGEGSMDPLIP